MWKEDLKYSQERGKGLEGKLRVSSRALKMEPELSMSWRQSTILLHPLTEQKNVSSTKWAQNKCHEKGFIKRRTCSLLSVTNGTAEKMLFCLTPEVPVNMTGKAIKLSLVVWLWTGIHPKHCWWLGWSACVCTSDREHQWQAANIIKSTYTIKSVERGGVIWGETWHWVRTLIPSSLLRSVWALSISKHDCTAKIPVASFSFQWKQSCTPKILAIWQANISRGIRFPRGEKLGCYLQSNWNMMEVFTKLNNGQKIIRTRSKQLLEPSGKELSQNSLASQKRQKYDQVFEDSMKCVWADWKPLLK